MFHVSKITLILEPNLNNFILVQTLGKPNVAIQNL